MSSDLIRPGSALVTNTMICQGSRFLEDPASVIGTKLDAFFDLTSLVEAVILRDRLYTLDGDITGYSRNYNTLHLVSALKQEGILCEATVPIDPTSVKRALVAIVGSERTFRQLNLDGFITSIANFVPLAFPDEHDSMVANKNFPEGDRQSLMMLMSHPNASSIIRPSANAFEFFHGDGFLNLLRGTGDIQRGGYALRTFLYSQSAVIQRICFMPDYSRIPFLESVTDALYTNLVIDGYASISKKLECEADDFLTDASPLGLPLPPFMSILLNRCKRPRDLPSVLFEMRTEFKELRKSITSFEESLISSVNIQERNKVRKNVKLTFDAMEKKYDSDSWTNFKRVIDFAGDLSQPLYNWTSPSAYKTSLLVTPVETLMDWWYRRPLMQFFDVMKEFRKIESYNLLVKKIFGIQFSEDEIIKFMRARKSYSDMFVLKDKTG